MYDRKLLKFMAVIEMAWFSSSSAKLCLPAKEKMWPASLAASKEKEESHFIYKAAYPV
jgi:hypothetical protein